MKWSIFNVVKKEQESVNIFNTLTRAAVTLENELYYQEPNNLPDNMQGDLLGLGIMVPDDTDETILFKYWYNLKVTQKKFLAITYIPTYKCNFKCPYCIEGKIEDTGLKVKTQEIYEYINQVIRESKCEIIDFVFYGGEPLLAIENVINTAQFIKGLAEKYVKKLNISMVTNGYLLNDECASELIQNGITTFQITIDGIKESHNLRRIHKNGTGTYENIVNNVKNILEKHTDANVVLNLNYDETNYNDILQFISQPPFDLKRVYLKLNPIKNSCKNLDQIGIVEHLNDARILYNQLKNNDLYDSNNVLNEYGPCLKRIRNSFIVDCYGDLYKCVFGVGNRLNKVGTIYEGMNRKVYSEDLIIRDKCKECAVLPICMTGCPRIRNEFGKVICKKDEIMNTIVIPILDNF